MKDITNVSDYKVEVDADLTEKGGKYLYNKYKNFPFIFKHVRFKKDSSENTLTLTDHLSKYHTTISTTDIEPILDKCVIKSNDIKVELRFKDDKRLETALFHNTHCMSCSKSWDVIIFNKITVHYGTICFDYGDVLGLMVDVHSLPVYHRILEIFLEAVKNLK